MIENYTPSDQDIFFIENIFEDENITSEEFNKPLITLISKNCGWYISNDEERQKIQVSDNFSDTGMLLETFYHKSESLEKDNDVNLIASSILSKVLELLPVEFEGVFPIRFLWNYYNRSSDGVSHRDIADFIPGNFFSVIYYLNTCDGKTIIEEESIDSVSGSCVAFNSKKIHRGTGPKKNPQRFCLNIIFQYEKMSLKK